MSINLSINKNQYYRVRFRVHKRLVPYFKKGYINKSLNTKDKTQARLKANKIYYPYQQILNTVFIITSEQTQELVNKFIREELEQNVMEVFTIDASKYKSISDSATLIEAYEKFCIWYKQQNITKKQYLITTSKIDYMLLPYFGQDTYVEEVTLESIEEFREFLSEYPNTNKKRYKRLSFEQITKIKKIPQEDIIGISTQIKYLKILKQFFFFMTRANILNYNPCTLLNMPNKDILNREPFNSNDISKLFSIFETLDNRKYIYYILAYTGMRPSELWKCKIANSEDNIVYFDLTDKDLELKTSSSRRVIPLHNKLLEMSIDKRLPSLQIEFSQAILSAYFNKVIKPRITDNPSKIMYSFRHTVATELKRAEVSMDKVSEILGHTYENNSITKEVYASGYTLIQLQTAINHLNYG